ncbi:hypothetical protein ScPMuIL_004715 [Solemya velum]
MGLDVKLFPAGVDSDLVCHICKNVLLEPVETTCSHIFCRICLRDSLLQTKMEFCPVCNTTMDYFVKQPSAEFKLRLLGLTIDCNNGCGTVCKLEELPDHVSETCPNTPVSCSNKSSGCKKIVRRCDVNRHANECDFKKIVCEACGHRTILRDIYSHQRRVRCLEKKLKQQLVRELRKTETETKRHTNNIQQERMKVEIEQRKALERARSFRTDNDTLDTGCDNLYVVQYEDEDMDSERCLGITRTSNSARRGGTIVNRVPNPSRAGENVFSCRRCERLFKPEANSMTSCHWHAGPVSSHFSSSTQHIHLCWFH